MQTTERADEPCTDEHAKSHQGASGSQLPRGGSAVWPYTHGRVPIGSGAAIFERASNCSRAGPRIAVGLPIGVFPLRTTVRAR